MKKVLILSDTHGDYVVFKKIIDLEQPDVTVHAGDFCIDVQEMHNNFDYFVAGNNDFDGERIVDFELENFKIRVMHGDQFGNSIFNINDRNQKILEYARENKIDILINGHTHIESMLYKDNILVINPGSLSLPRNMAGKKSYAILILEKEKILNNKFEEIFKYIN